MEQFLSIMKEKFSIAPLTAKKNCNFNLGAGNPHPILLRAPFIEGD